MSKLERPRNIQRTEKAAADKKNIKCGKNLKSERENILKFKVTISMNIENPKEIGLAWIGKLKRLMKKDKIVRS